MNAYEQRQHMRKGRSVPTVSVDVEAERQAHKQRMEAKASAERQESSRVRHLRLNTPVKPWSKDEGVSKAVHAYLSDMQGARERGRRRAAERMMSGD